MSVADPVIDYLDLSTKSIYLLVGTREYHPVDDIYCELRNLRRTDETMRVFDMPVYAFGAVPKGGGKYTPRYAQFNNGWTVVPEDITHDLYISGEQITDDGQSGKACMDLTGLSAGANIFIHYEPPSAEIIQLNSNDIEYAAFNGGISYTEDGGYAGTGTAPNGANIGTPRAPSNNVYDARTIAIDRGFNTGYILNDMNVPVYELDGFTPFEIEGFIFEGSGKDRSEIVIPEDALVSECTYINAHVTGYLDGNNTVIDCLIDNLYYIKGFIEQCILAPGTIVLGGSDTAHFLDCFSGVPGTGTPTIDMGGAGQPLALRNYNGGIKLINKSGPESVSIDLNSGQVKLDMTTVTNGTIVVRGVGKLIDADTGDHIVSGTYGSLVILNELVYVDGIVENVWDYERV